MLEAQPGQPMYVALVDLTCGPEFLELVKSGVLAALEAVPPTALFGLVTFSTKVRTYCSTAYSGQRHNDSVALSP